MLASPPVTMNPWVPAPLATAGAIRRSQIGIDCTAARTSTFATDTFDSITAGPQDARTSFLGLASFKSNKSKAGKSNTDKHWKCSLALVLVLVLVCMHSPTLPLSNMCPCPCAQVALLEHQTSEFYHAEACACRVPQVPCLDISPRSLRIATHRVAAFWIATHRIHVMGRDGI